MGRYDALKHPFAVSMGGWAYRKTNDAQERQPKSIPCHVTKVDKDFITVAFETQNNIFTPPTVKIPQSWSKFSREPTQVGDKGYAVPGDYYLGGVTDDAGGSTDFYPRGNLTTLSFNGISHKKSPDRDYDQLTHMGGPTGWIVGPFQKQQEDQQNQQNQQTQQVQTALGLNRTSSFSRQQQSLRTKAGLPGLPGIPGLPGLPGGGIGGIIQQVLGGLLGGQQQQQQKDKTCFSFDKNAKCLIQSKDEKHNVTVDQQNKTVSMKADGTIYHDPGSGKVYLGGDGKDGKYCRIGTECGISQNVYAKV
jgi:hypothetical protein